MKISGLLITLVLLAGCSSPTGETNAPASAASPAASAIPAASPEAVNAASASGVVQSVDVAAKTVTIAHGPVNALGWPAMTMSFKAPNADLSSIKQGDQVSFEFTSAGMNGTITTISRE